jgi:LysM domain
MNPNHGEKDWISGGYLNSCYVGCPFGHVVAFREIGRRTREIDPSFSVVFDGRMGRFYCTNEGAHEFAVDSGRPVTARSGDSLETLAAAYHVPLWSLTQANHLPDGTPLAVGTHIVVPRHLGPLAVQTSFKTSGQKRATRAASRASKTE